MTEAGHELQSILESIQQLSSEVEEAQPGDAELAAVIASVTSLQARLKRVRSVLGPLMPQASRGPSLDEKTADELEQTLISLRRAAEARQSTG
jgi:hypothetical protein